MCLRERFSRRMALPRASGKTRSLPVLVVVRITGGPLLVWEAVRRNVRESGPTSFQASARSSAGLALDRTATTKNASKRSPLAASKNRATPSFVMTSYSRSSVE